MEKGFAAVVREQITVVGGTVAGVHDVKASLDARNVALEARYRHLVALHFRAVRRGKRVAGNGLRVSGGRGQRKGGDHCRGDDGFHIGVFSCPILPDTDCLRGDGNNGSDLKSLSGFCQHKPFCQQLLRRLENE